MFSTLFGWFRPMSLPQPSASAQDLYEAYCQAFPGEAGKLARPWSKLRSWEREVWLQVAARARQ